MEKEGLVSLWIGNMRSQDLLDEYISIDDFDEDFIEKVCYWNDINTLKELINGCSYEDIIINKFINMIGDKLPKEINSAILLYDFVYDDNERS